MKDYKIKRYGRDRRRQKTAATARVVLMVALIAAACCAGWFLYDPISEWMTEKAIERQERREEQQRQQGCKYQKFTGFHARFSFLFGSSGHSSTILSVRPEYHIFVFCQYFCRKYPVNFNNMQECM